jgi:phosphatidylserine/phosphatidylglycerophosphate/cardiolipin synthase-like enzyme
MTRALLFAGVLLLSAFSLQAFSSQAELQNSIVLNEVVYNPQGPEVEGEWIEIFNGGDDVDIQDWTITDQDNWIFQFPSLAVPRECYIVLHIGPGIPDSDFSDCVAHLYSNKTTPRLNNAGDDLLLQDGLGAAIDFFSYGSGSGLDHPPPGIEWDSAADTVPEGYSASVFPNGYEIDTHESWIQSSPSPGETNGELSGVPDGVRISEIYYNAYRDDEYVTIENFSPVEEEISSWMITDLEGYVAFPAGTSIPSQNTLYVTRNSTSFFEDTLFQADFQYESGDAEPMAVIGNIPQLNNDGDEVVLLDDHGRVVDVFVYGYSNYDGTGWNGDPVEALWKGKIAKRSSDTNSSHDWTGLREYGIGQSDFDTHDLTFQGSITAFSSPDTSFKVITEAIEEADTSIDINLYEFTNKAIASALVSALDRGVTIRVLLEGTPVGGIKTPELEILDQLSDQGAEVRLLLDDEVNDIHSRYTFNHGKYMLIDDDEIIVGSENWGNSGVPENNRTGNRGWGIMVEASEVHDYYMNVFESDWNPLASDSVEYVGMKGEFEPSEPSEDVFTDYEYAGGFPIRSIQGSFSIEPVISPDTSLEDSTVLEMMRSAEDEILLEQFYIRPHWGKDKDTANPYLDEIIKAARRGVEVRVLLDSSWYNVGNEDPYDNDDVVDELNGLADSEGLQLEAKLINSNSHGFLKLHNKGMIADGSSVLISSINWNKNSIASNREIGMIVHNEDVASFYRELFFYDWKDDVTAPIADAGEDLVVGQHDAVQLDGGGSFDDVGIANYSWDLDGDGIFEVFGPNAAVDSSVLGNFTITLRVLDTWGNVGTDSCLVSVRSFEGEGQSQTDDGWGGIALMTVVIIGILVPATFFLIGNKKQKDIRKPDE